MLERVLKHLEQLVACDTQNPPRAIKADHPIFAYCSVVLEEAGCNVKITDLGHGCVNLHATRGQTDLLFNCHLDTVPADPAWTQNPFALNIEPDRAVGLGACDIKGAAACLLAAAQDSDAPFALLLSSDEEAGKSDCVYTFLEHGFPYTQVIVCEPTNAKALIKHRGIDTFELEFTGIATHSSQTNAHEDNALHHASAWCARALEYMHSTLEDNLRFNIGLIQGGVKTNIAASSAMVRFGIRPHAETDVDALLEYLMGYLVDPGRATLNHCFSAPALNSVGAGEAMIERFGLSPCPPADFWTEAALFAHRVESVLVLGPGDIAQAHSPDEFVTLDSLQRTAELYSTILQTAQSTSPQSQAILP